MIKNPENLALNIRLGEIHKEMEAVHKNLRTLEAKILLLRKVQTDLADEKKYLEIELFPPERIQRQAKTRNNPDTSDRIAGRLKKLLTAGFTEEEILLLLEKGRGNKDEPHGKKS